jgi:hypothetical protein
MFELEYLTDKNGQLKAVVIPVELWEQLFLKNDASAEELSEAIEDYCLNKAMDEAKVDPLLSREEALAYLES